MHCARTSALILSVVCRIVVRVPNEFLAGTQETVRQLRKMEKCDYSHRSSMHEQLTDSMKSPAAAIYALITCGVIMRLVGSLMLSSGTSMGRSCRVMSLTRRTRPGGKSFCFVRMKGCVTDAYLLSSQARGRETRWKGRISGLQPREAWRTVAGLFAVPVNGETQRAGGWRRTGE